MPATLIAIVSPSARRRGVWARLLKEMPRVAVAGAWATIAEAKAACPRCAAIVLDLRCAAHSAGAAPLLSGREQQVLALLAHGCRDKELPARLGVSAGTARTYLRRAQAKLGTTSRTEAVARWVRIEAEAGQVAKSGDKTRLSHSQHRPHRPAPF